MKHEKTHRGSSSAVGSFAGLGFRLAEICDKNIKTCMGSLQGVVFGVSKVAVLHFIGEKVLCFVLQHRLGLFPKKV